jgi:hypothetical protein
VKSCMGRWVVGEGELWRESSIDPMSRSLLAWQRDLLWMDCG